MEHHTETSELVAFIREHRSSEANFEKLYQRLDQEIDKEENKSYQVELSEIKEKHADEYRRNKEKNASSWSEFEKFVTHFERLSIDMDARR